MLQDHYGRPTGPKKPYSLIVLNQAILQIKRAPGAYVSSQICSWSIRPFKFAPGGNAPGAYLIYNITQDVWDLPCLLQLLTWLHVSDYRNF